jgi:uncharacterized protein (DUF1684 family)
MPARYTLTLLLITLSVASGCNAHRDSLADETQRIEAWRQRRITSLTSDNGWLTLAGLYWLKQGSNRFGRDPHNELVLDQPAAPDDIGTFELQGNTVQFIAASSTHVTANGRPVTQLKLSTDATDKPTTLTLGSLRFFAIERAGQIGIRVRDIEHPARKNFQGLNYFPISTEWRIDARYEPYTPSKHIAIVNILGMTEQMESPGALVFNKDGQTWRLEALRESPTDRDLFVMLTDATSGRDTYGAGRYIYVRMPIGKQVWLDFNQAFNPPCAFTEFATCPLPPRQNRLQLAVTAGEKKYAAH